MGKHAVSRFRGRCLIKDPALVTVQFVKETVVKAPEVSCHKIRSSWVAILCGQYALRFGQTLNNLSHAVFSSFCVKAEPMPSCVRSQSCRAALRISSRWWIMIMMNYPDAKRWD